MSNEQAPMTNEKRFCLPTMVIGAWSLVIQNDQNLRCTAALICRYNPPNRYIPPAICRIAAYDRAANTND